MAVQLPADEQGELILQSFHCFLSQSPPRCSESQDTKRPLVWDARTLWGQLEEATGLNLGPGPIFYPLGWVVVFCEEVLEVYEGL